MYNTSAVLCVLAYSISFGVSGHWIGVMAINFEPLGISETEVREIELLEEFLFCLRLEMKISYSPLGWSDGPWFGRCHGRFQYYFLLLHGPLQISDEAGADRRPNCLHALHIVAHFDN